MRPSISWLRPICRSGRKIKKESIPYDERKKELQKVKIFIADRNVYGVDMNPTAVELAEVSLWLNTIHEGG